MEMNSVEVILGYLIIAAFLVACIWWKRPTTDGGRLTLLFIVVNAVGWLALLPQDFTYQHGLSLGTFILLLCFVVNLALLPAAIISLIVGFKEGERRSFVAIAATYLGLNFFLWIALPLCAMILAAIGLLP